MPEIFHIAFRDDWADAVAGRPYSASSRNLSVAEEGFTHCALARQVAGVLDRIYADVNPQQLILLVLDTGLIEADGVSVKYEDTHGAGEDFPHVYGALRLAWVVRTEPLPH